MNRVDHEHNVTFYTNPNTPKRKRIHLLRSKEDGHASLQPQPALSNPDECKFVKAKLAAPAIFRSTFTFETLSPYHSHR